MNNKWELVLYSTYDGSREGLGDIKLRIFIEKTPLDVSDDIEKIKKLDLCHMTHSYYGWEELMDILKRYTRQTKSSSSKMGSLRNSKKDLMKDGLSTKQENKLPHSRKKVRRSPARPPNKKLEDVKMKKTKTHKDVEIINCTPHDITFIFENHIDDEFYAIEKFIIKKSGIIPRVKEIERKTDVFKIKVTRESEIEEDGYDNGWNIYVDIMEKSFTEVEGLPEPKENTYYIVSALVAGACKNRDDLVVPNDTVRDDQGRIIGCRSLARI